MEDKWEEIKVYARIRPLNSRELAEDDEYDEPGRAVEVEGADTLEVVSTAGGAAHSRRRAASRRHFERGAAAAFVAPRPHAGRAVRRF